MAFEDVNSKTKKYSGGHRSFVINEGASDETLLFSYGKERGEFIGSDR